MWFQLLYPPLQMCGSVMKLFTLLEKFWLAACQFQKLLGIISPAVAVDPIGLLRALNFQNETGT